MVLDSIKNLEQNQNVTNSKQDEFEKLNLLPCDHYEYEFKSCNSLKGKFYDYYRGETQEHECKYYQDMFVECLKYKRDPEKNFNSLIKLKNYENELIKKRVDSVIKNDVWTLRQEPPSDWNSKLPDWCLERLKETYWYKARNQQAQQNQ